LNTWTRTAPAALAVAAVLLSLPAMADEFSDTWFEATLAGAAMGYLHETVVADDDGQMTTTLESDFTMRRGESLVAVKGLPEIKGGFHTCHRTCVLEGQWAGRMFGGRRVPITR
jgi:hypothetical protein